MVNLSQKHSVRFLFLRKHILLQLFVPADLTKEEFESILGFGVGAGFTIGFKGFKVRAGKTGDGIKFWKTWSRNWF